MTERNLGFHELQWGADDWRKQANCRGLSRQEKDDIFFFTSEDEADSLEKLARARTFCDPCPVRENCLEFALVNNQYHGIWGGMSNKQRREIKYLKRLSLLKQEEQKNG